MRRKLSERAKGGATSGYAEMDTWSSERICGVAGSEHSSTSGRACLLRRPMWGPSWHRGLKCASHFKFIGPSL